MILSQYLKDMFIIQEKELTLGSKQAKESNRLTLTMCKLNKNIMSQGLKKASHKKSSPCFNKWSQWNKILLSRWKAIKIKIRTNNMALESKNQCQIANLKLMALLK